LPACYQDELPPVPLDIFQQEITLDDMQITFNAPEISGAMEMDSTSPELPTNISLCNTKKDTYSIYHSFPHQFPSFVPCGALKFICDSPNFNVTTPKHDWWALPHHNL